MAVAAAIGGYFLLKGGSGADGSDPKAVAGAFAKAMSDHDKSGRDYICRSDKAQFAKFDKDAGSTTTKTDMPDLPKVTATVGNVKTSGDKGTFDLNLSMSMGSSDKPLQTTQHYDLVKESGDWKVCGILAATTGGLGN